MARSRTRSRVKSRRNRRPSKARTRRVYKRRMGRVSKRRTRRTSKRGRRFQRGGMEPEPTVESPFLNIHTIGGLPAVSVDTFYLKDQSPERYHRLLMERAKAYATSLERTIKEEIEKLKSDIKSDIESAGGNFPDNVPEIEAKKIEAKVDNIYIGEKYLQEESPLFGIDDQIVFEFVDVTIEPNPTFSMTDTDVYDKATSGEDLGSYYSGSDPLPCFEIIVMINPLRYIVIRGTYDEILKLYPPKSFEVRGATILAIQIWDNVETKSQTILDNIKEYLESIIENTHITAANHPLRSMTKLIDVEIHGGDEAVRDSVFTIYGKAKDLLPPQISWGKGTNDFGMSEEALRDYRG